MKKISPNINNPVRDLQTYLRTISLAENKIPLLIPDGIFGEKTRDTVLAFQKQMSLPETGEVDELVWRKITEKYDKAVKALKEPSKAVIYPSCEHKINCNDRCDTLLIIQSIIKILSQRFSNVNDIDINGVNDEKTQKAIKCLQKCFNVDETGAIDRKFWDFLSSLYKTCILHTYLK